MVRNGVKKKDQAGPLTKANIMNRTLLIFSLKRNQLRSVMQFIFILLSPAISLSQRQKTNSAGDSAEGKTLQPVIINAYAQNRMLAEVPAAVNFVGQTQLNRFGNSSILSAVNSNPGVRMEERSPGSYRFNIRGSSLRSPFGVRDVKVYFNEIPLTDPGGNTYLNQLGFYNFQSIEIIKGPAGSMYGAGTGGAVLIKSLPDEWKPGAELDYTVGSFASKNINAIIRLGKTGNQSQLGYSHQTSNGYRHQSMVHRDVASWETLLKLNEKRSLHAYILYSDLFYQTPGALTLTEYNAGPTQARPHSGTSAGAIENEAAISQKIFTVGFSHDYHFGNNWQNTSSVYGAYTDFSNPGIRVYEKRKEPHFGGRTVFQYLKECVVGKVQVNAGMEGQKGFFNTKDYRNKLGAIDTLQTDDDINTWLYTVFAQVDLTLKKGWIVTAGASMNKSSITFTRLSKRPVTDQRQTFENKIAPRIAVLKKINRDISVYASASHGFSPPTASELLRSNGVIGTNLQPGDGIDLEFGARGTLLNNKFTFDVNVFSFMLKNMIVQRIDSAGAYYYVNSGATKQQGFEGNIRYDIINRPTQFLSRLRTWVSYTYHDFHYRNFQQLKNDFSGKRLPGVAPQTIVAGLDLSSRGGWYSNITYTYSDAIQLNDANTDIAGSYHLLGIRAGCKGIPAGSLRFEIFAGAENIFNTHYSLGNDINAALGRYYNAAPGINYYAGVAMHF